MEFLMGFWQREGVVMRTRRQQEPVLPSAVIRQKDLVNSEKRAELVRRQTGWRQER